MRLLLLSAILMLSACGHSRPLTMQAKPPANAMARCPSLDNPKVATNPDKYTRYVLDEYYACAYRHDGLVEFYSGEVE